MKILILYGTDEGQTRKVAAHIETVLKERGHETEMVQGNKAPKDFSPDGFDAAVVGTSIHMDVHQISVRKLVKANSASFARIPSAYFCVCLTAYSTTPRDKKQLQKYIDQFTHYTGWQPQRIATFPGALQYRKYNMMKRFAAKLLARKLGADTDTSGDYEYTNWAAVTKFAEEFADLLEKRDYTEGTADEL